MIGWAIYQPSGTTASATDATAGKRCRDALSQYQYNRSVYIAIASVGPIPYDITANAPVAPGTYKNADIDEWESTILPQIWAQACDVCQADRKWDDKGFDNPPWQGVKKGKKEVGGRDLKCQLTTPHELK